MTQKPKSNSTKRMTLSELREYERQISTPAQLTGALFGIIIGPASGLMDNWPFIFAYPAVLILTIAGAALGGYLHFSIRNKNFAMLIKK